MIRASAAAALLALALAGCGSGRTGGTADGSTEPTNGFWPKPWTETTCGEWRDQTTPGQRLVGAGGMIRALRSVEGLRDKPELASVMMSAITNVCSALPGTDTSSVADLAIAIYKSAAINEDQPQGFRRP